MNGGQSAGASRGANAASAAVLGAEVNRLSLDLRAHPVCLALDRRLRISRDGLTCRGCRRRVPRLPIEHDSGGARPQPTRRRVDHAAPTGRAQPDPRRADAGGGCHRHVCDRPIHGLVLRPLGCVRTPLHAYPLVRTSKAAIHGSSRGRTRTRGDARRTSAHKSSASRESRNTSIQAESGPEAQRAGSSVGQSSGLIIVPEGSPRDRLAMRVSTARR